MTAVPVLRNYIAGTFTDSADLLDVTNPATGALLARAPRSTQGDVDRAIAAAHGARQAWARRPAIEGPSTCVAWPAASATTPHASPAP